MSRRKLPLPLRELARTAHQVLSLDVARQKDLSLTDLAVLFYDRPHPGEIKQSMDRQTVPQSRRVLSGIRQVSPRAIRIFGEWIHVLNPQVPLQALREPFAQALGKLSFPHIIVEQAKKKDLIFDRGVFRSQAACDHLSLFVLEVVTLRRLVNSAPFADSLEQGWYVALALLECIEDIPPLKENAEQLWCWIVEQYLPSEEHAIRYGTSFDRLGIVAPFSANSLIQRVYAFARLLRSVSLGLPVLDRKALYQPIEVPNPLMCDFTTAVASILLATLKGAPTRDTSGVRYLKPLQTNPLAPDSIDSTIAIAVHRQSRGAQEDPSYALHIGIGARVLKYMV